MLIALQVVSALLVAIAMGLSLAHALELPGKLRLEKADYLVVQRIYYPGFTIGGIAEILGIAIIGVLLFLTPSTAAFAWTLASLLALFAMHLAYWVLTHPVNKFWMKDQDLKTLGAGFFGIGGASTAGEDSDDESLWIRYRNRWEMSHVLRAGLAGLSLALLVIGIAI